MRYFLSLSFLFFFLTFNGYAQNLIQKDEFDSAYHVEDGKTATSEPNLQLVYVCISQKAYAYHSRSDCAGLNNCKGEIKYTDEEYAVNVLSRVPCCRCWTNVENRCKDDNPYYNATDNPELYAYVALAVVATSVIILSNDMYVYPVISFYNPTKYHRFGNRGSAKIGIGSALGFRKTFKHSALEYGVSHVKTEVKYTSGFIGGYSYTEKLERWGWHLNYVHQIFHNNTPKWLKIYLGPSINHVYDFGYGGIVGTEIKLFDRLRFDVRYEWTTQTNQVQAGLIFTYQKKYFWQKK